MIAFIKQKRIYLLEIIFLFLLSLVPLIWFKPDHVVAGLDSGYAIDYVRYFDQRSSTWLSSQNFGIDMSFEVGAVPYSLYPAAINRLGLSGSNVQIVLFISWFFILLLSIYALLLYLFSEKNYWSVRLIGSTIFAFNLHIYSFWLQGEQPILASYVLLPIFTLFLLKFAKDNLSPLKTAIYLNVAYFIFNPGGVRGLPLIGPVIITALVIFLYYFVINYRQKKIYITRLLSLFVFGILLFILSNAYFLLPFIASFSLQYATQIDVAGGIGGAIDWARFISTHANFLNLFRLQGDNNWYDKPYLWPWVYITNPILIIGSFIFPILAFLAPLLVRNIKNKQIILLFTLLALIGIFFSAGTHPPLGGAYELMMRYIPGFAAFRSAYYKFIPIVYLSFSILIAVTVYYLLTKFQKKESILFSILMIILILGYHFPYFSSSNFAFNKPFSSMIEIPKYIKDFARMENANIKDFRTLVLPPPASAYGIVAYDWGYWSSYPIFPLLTDKDFITNDSFSLNANENNIIISLYADLRKQEIDKFLNLADKTNIKYILITEDFAKDYFASVSEDPKIYLNILKINNGVFKETWSEGPWHLFEITSVSPTKINGYNSLYLNNNKDDIGGIIDANLLPFSDTNNRNLNTLYNQGFQNFPCISCKIFNEESPPELSIPNVLPGGIFYQLKLSIENNFKIAKTNDERVNALIGLSLKRVSELDRLNSTYVEPEGQWLESASLLKDYWNKIENIYFSEYKQSSDYPELKRILQYINLERDVLDKLINNGSNYKFISVLKRTKISMDRVRSDLFQRLSLEYWKKTFVYDISSSKDIIYLNSSSLPKDSSGNVILPNSYKLDNIIYNFPHDTKISPSIKVMPGTKLLTLIFNVPNLFIEPIEKTLEIGGLEKKCLVAPIISYSGIKKYIITSDLSGNESGVLYIKRKYNKFITQDLSVRESTSDFIPDTAVDIPVDDLNKLEYLMQGRLNDSGADIYFCLNSLNDPRSVFKNISVTELYNPQVYSINKMHESKNVLPTISFYKLSPTKYKIQIKNAKNPFILYFSERFSPLWEIQYKDIKIKEHFMANGFANAWYLNKQGTYELNLTFKSQKIMLLGVIISLTTFIILLCVLIIILINYVKNKKI